MNILVEISAHWLSFSLALVNDLVLDDSFVVIPVPMVVVSVSSLPPFSSFTLPLNLPRTLFAGFPDGVREIDDLQYILLRVC